MAKLPTVADLGPTPRAAPTRPMASTLAGGQAVPEGIQKLGAGVAKFGEGIGELSLDESRWDYAKAHADFLSRKVERDGALAEDRNYGPDEDGKSMPERYEKDVNDLRTQSASMIRSGPMRERFMQETNPSVAHGVETARKHARTLENQTNVGYVHEMGDNLINKALDAKDDDIRMQLIDSHNQLVDGLVAKGAVTPDHAVTMKKTWAHQYATADALRRADTDPEGVINELRAKPGSNEAITNRILQIEGTGKNAKSSATGAGQFIDSTWLDVLKRNRPDLAQGRGDSELLALRGDKRLGREMTDAYRSENEAYLKKKGVEATPGAQYLAHFLGPGGAAAVLKGDPNKPVVDVLAATVGRQKAQAMVDANPSILQGQLAGSVKQWADNKMGGQVPGGGSIYDQLRPDVREQILSHARTQLQKNTVNDLSSFRQRWNDTIAEAYNNPEGPKQPMTQGDFVQAVGAEKAKTAYESYKGELDLASDMHKVESMSPSEMQELYESYTPKSGPGYADAAKRQDSLEKAMAKVNEARKHPADFAATKLPASKEAWGNFAQTMSSPTASPEDRKAAAQDYASKALLEQQRVDIPAEQRAILPKSYLDNFNKSIAKAADAEDPQARIGLVGRIQQEAEMWGEHWPAVMRQIAPDAQPIVRAIAAGADPVAMTRLLSLPKEEAKKPATILKQQNETKYKDLNDALIKEFAPFMRSMVGRQKDRDYGAYYHLGQELGALHVRDGKSASDAASAAFKSLIGDRYEFKDNWRMPKSAGVSADDVQAGTVAARNSIGNGSLPFGHLGSIAPAENDIGLTDPRSDSFSKFARDGQFVTSHDNSGLNLVYGDKFVKKSDGSPLLLTWPELAKMGKDAPRGFQMSWPRG